MFTSCSDRYLPASGRRSNGEVAQVALLVFRILRLKSLDFFLVGRLVIRHFDILTED